MMKGKNLIKIIGAISGVGVCGWTIYKLANLLITEALGVGFGYSVGITEMAMANATADQSVITEMEGIVEKFESDEPLTLTNVILVDGVKRGIQKGKTDSITYELKNKFLYK